MYLLDTHVLVWAVGEPERLSVRVRDIVDSGQVKVSAVSFWELVLKKNKKKPPVERPVEWWDRFITRASVEVISIRIQHIRQLDKLPNFHGDPFDRMLIAQAAFEGLQIVTADAVIAQYTGIVW